MDTKVTLDWLNEVFTEAAEQSRNNSFGLLNGLTKSPALSFYYINVHKTKTVTPDQFANQYAGFLNEAELIRKQTLALEESTTNAERITNIEAELAKLPDMIKAALAEALANVTVAPVTEAKKPVKKPAAKVEIEPEPEVQVETEDDGDNAESEA